MIYAMTLCVQVALVQEAINLGFDTVAINIDLGEVTEKIPGFLLRLTVTGSGLDLVRNALGFEEAGENGEPTRKKRKKDSRLKSIPDPFVVPESDLDLSRLAQEGRHFRCPPLPSTAARF